MMMYSKPEVQNFVVRKAVSVYDREGILMVVPQDDNETPMQTATKHVEKLGYTVIFRSFTDNTMVVAR